MGAMAGCCIRLAEESTFPDDAGSVKEIFEDNAWFDSVNVAVQAGLRGRKGVLQSRTTSHCPKGFIEDVLLGMPGGVHIVLVGTHHEIPLVALMVTGTAQKQLLFFVFTKDAGSTVKHLPYEMKWMDDHGHVCGREVDQLDVVSKFFQKSNCVDVHNQSWQYDLVLEKHGVTYDPYFCLHTVLLGMNVIDTWKLALYHKLFKQNDNMTSEKFAGILAYQLIHYANNLSLSSITENSTACPTASIMLPTLGHSSASLVTLTLSSCGTQQLVDHCSLTDINGVIHYQVLYDKICASNRKKQTLTRECKLCMDGRHFLYTLPCAVQVHLTRGEIALQNVFRKSSEVRVLIMR